MYTTAFLMLSFTYLQLYFLLLTYVSTSTNLVHCKKQTNLCLGRRWNTSV